MKGFFCLRLTVGIVFFSGIEEHLADICDFLIQVND